MTIWSYQLSILGQLLLLLFIDSDCTVANCEDCDDNQSLCTECKVTTETVGGSEVTTTYTLNADKNRCCKYKKETTDSYCYQYMFQYHRSKQKLDR